MLMEQLPALTAVPSASRLDLFLSKLKHCEQSYDFSNPRSQFPHKEAKRRYLVDLTEYVSTHKAVFNDLTYAPFLRMVSANIFRALPVASLSDHVFDTDDDDPYFDPAWPHLQLVYELLRKFVVSSDTDSKPARACITVEFVTAVVDLFQSEDPREREYLKTILHRIYGKVMPLRVPIRKAIMNVFHRVVYENQRHNGVAELLEILGSIINGFSVPLKDEHKELLRKGLLPLHIPGSMPNYHVQLSFCVTQYVEKDPALASETVLCLMKHWPGRNTRKEVMLLNEIEEVLELTRPQDLESIVVAVFRRISRCIESPHFQVAERSLFYWNNEFVINLMMMYREQVMPVVVASLQRNLASHWNANVLSLTCNVQRLLAEMDLVLFDRCCKVYEAERKDEGRKKAERAERWRAVYRMAQKRGSLNKGVNRVKGGMDGDAVGNGVVVGNKIGTGWGHVERTTEVRDGMRRPGDGVVQMLEARRQARA
eukprot:GFKZ01010027.1.p1 GENE.GFKZ01010027.1~~GFKZ01010027.1.p1  ORF type:complete len:483 (-),score=69.41 GFKZ01010027.1:464-1912(-)